MAQKIRNKRLFSGLRMYRDDYDRNYEFVVVNPQSLVQKIHAYFLLRQKKVQFAVPKNWKEIRGRKRFTANPSDVLNWS
jgi:hypothetical protein